MIIEFIGMPGSGKTTLLPVVVGTLNSMGFHAYSVVDAARPFASRTLIGKVVERLAPPTWRKPLLWQVFYHLSKFYRLRFTGINRDLIQNTRRFQRRRPVSAKEREHVLYWFFHQIGYFEFLSAYAGSLDVLIFDEGFIHRVVQLFASDVEEPDFASTNAYIDLIPRPDLVIFTDAPVEVCEQRIYARGIWEHYRQKTPEQVSRYLNNAHRIVNHAVGYIKSKDWVVIDIECGMRDGAIAGEELRGKLSQLLLFQVRSPQFQPLA